MTIFLWCSCQKKKKMHDFIMRKIIRQPQIEGHFTIEKCQDDEGWGKTEELSKTTGDKDTWQLNAL